MTGEVATQPREPRRFVVVLGALTFLVLALPWRIFSFVLLVTLLSVGVGTFIIWAGLPLLALALAANDAFARLERFWVRRLLRLEIAAPYRRSTTGSVWQRFLGRLTDPVTWRYLGYQLIALPLGCVEFALGLAGTILVPVGIWIVPAVAGLHAQLVGVMLGSNRNTELRAKAEHLQASRARGIDAAEAERRRIERDLHDGAQQRLVAVAMGLGRARAKMDTDPDSARTLVDEAHSDAKLAIAELRDLARGIYPAVLGDRGLDAALSALAARSTVPVQVTVAADPRPPTAVESCAYFIVAEALTNLAKHANASKAEVSVSSGIDRVVVEVTDNGRGGAEITPGGGLAGLADRAATLDGVVTVLSPAGGPTVLRADLPVTW